MDFDSFNKDNLEGEIKSRLEFIIREVCHHKLNVMHHYFYEDKDKGIFMHLMPLGEPYKMKLRIRNLNSPSDGELFDEYVLNFNINS
jgi:hypothetical protein